MKKIFAFTLFLFISAYIFAGDAAVFKDIGFSEDGLTYIFAQYGKTDKKYEAWAEIYTVDVVNNDFRRNEVYKKNPTKTTASMSGKKAYEDLYAASKSKFSKYSCVPYAAENLLYVRQSDDKVSTEEIVFKDFDNSSEGNEVYYKIKLVPTYEGKGAAVQSKFYISLKKTDSRGDVLLSKTLGTPDFKRKGITNYRIDRIFSDESGRSLIFIIEKTLEDDTGVSIRYMVEAIRL